MKGSPRYRCVLQRHFPKAASANSHSPKEYCTGLEGRSSRLHLLPCTAGGPAVQNMCFRIGREVSSPLVLISVNTVDFMTEKAISEIALNKHSLINSAKKG